MLEPAKHAFMCELLFHRSDGYRGLDTIVTQLSPSQFKTNEAFPWGLERRCLKDGGLENP